MSKSLLMLCAAGMLFVASPAISAPRDAGSKIRGDAYQFDSGSTYTGHAYDHARVLSDYSAGGQPVPKAVVKEHADAIRHNVTASKKAIAGLSDDAKKEAAKSLAIIDKAHAKALEACNMLDECCAKGDGDSTVVMKCCATATDELKAAQAEQEKLAKQLKLEKAPVKK